MYAIGILHKDNTIKYVTKVLPKHWAEWESGKEAIYFTKEEATQMCMGFALNFIAAVPILQQDWITLTNPAKETSDTEK